MTAHPAASIQQMTSRPAEQVVPSKLLGLQVLRFVAAFSVVLFHIGSGLQIEFGYEKNIFGYGAAGVDIFFVISGFIIAYTTDPAKGAWQFCRRRLARILPLYWTLTSGIVVLALIKPDLLNSTVVTGETILKSLFFIPFEKPNGLIQPLLFLGWTLNYEMVFYAVYAACLAFGLRSPLAPAVLIVLLVAAGRFVELDSVPWRFYTNPLMLEFVFGIGLYLLHARYPGLFSKRALLILAVFGAAVVMRELTPNLPWLLANGIPAVILVAAVLPWSPARTPSILFLVLLGDASYSLYLVHPYIIQALIKPLPDQSGLLVQSLAGVVACVLSVVISIVLYKIIERPMQALFNGWSSRGRPSSAARGR